MTQGAIAAVSPTHEDGLAVVSRGDAAMIRVSTELARQYPRDEAKVVAALLKTLDAYPQFADRCVYRIPYKDRDPDTGKQRTVWVTGLSIRAAEIMATAWGNLRVGVRVIDETDDHWELEAVCWDMQTNYWELTPARETKWLRRRDGRMEQLDERRLMQRFGAAASKVKRKCVLSVLPITLRAAFEERVHERAAGGPLTKPADKARVAACIAAFKDDYGVTEAQLQGHVGKARDLWVGQDLADLRALYSALADGEVALADAFPPADDDAPATPPTGRVVDAKDGAVTPQERGQVPAAQPPAANPQAAAPAATVVPGTGTPVAVTPPAVPASSAAPAAVTVDDAVRIVDDALAGITDASAIDGSVVPKLFGPNGALAGVPREVRRAALGRIGEKRDALVKAAATK